jgi:hypothetical protein
MSETPKAYAIEAAEGVAVQLDDSSDDETFSVTVVKAAEVVETHDAVTADSVVALTSEHFTASHIEVPTAPDDTDEDSD